MKEQYLDSSKNTYLKEKEISNYTKQVNWEMAIGLQKVDNLSPSSYLINLSDEYIKGDLTIEEVEESLKNYYIEHEQEKQINKHEKECDFVSLRIVELLNKDNFELSVDYLKYIHKYLFQDIYDFAGHFRNFDFSKHEEILNNDSVAYGSFKTLQASLEYDISLEKKKNYKDMSIIDVINNIVDFSSSIWQVHPFEEGNTRTTAVFIEKYLCVEKTVGQYKKELGELKFLEVVNKLILIIEKLTRLKDNDINYGIKELKKRGIKFDYIDDALFKGKKEVLVKCYIPLKQADEYIENLKGELNELSERTDTAGSLETVVREVDGESWREVWKSHYRPMDIGRIRVCPEWIECETPKGGVVVKIDSNMAFGTGEHETTSMCLMLLQKYLREGDVVTDIGTGSGILGISAVKLGAKRALMTDIDYIAVESAKRNALNNGASEFTEIVMTDLMDREREKADLITANITAGVLINLSKKAKNYIKSGGIMIMSGIILSKKQEVLTRYEEEGFCLQEEDIRGEWCALAMKRE